MATTGTKVPRDTARVRLKPRDSFDLIRLIARTQSDARKAIARLASSSGRPPVDS